MDIVQPDICNMGGAAAHSPGGPFLEYSTEDTPWAERLYEPSLEVLDGDLPIAAGPGWGVRISPAWLEKAEVQRSGGDSGKMIVG